MGPGGEQQTPLSSVFVDDEKRGMAWRIRVPDDGSFPRRYETNRRAGAWARTRGPRQRRSRSAMCCAQLDALQVEKRIGVSGSRTHLASGTASGRRRGPHRYEGVQTYSFLFLLLAGPYPSPPFISIYARPQRVIARLVTRKLTRFRV